MKNKIFELYKPESLKTFLEFHKDNPKERLDPLQSLISDWCHDDNGKNILYKKNGEERYPEFKLYKMIVRTVHNHIPEKQLKKEIFKKYISSKRKIKNGKIINIDVMESMIN